VRTIAIRDIYETGFDEDVRTESSTNQCPECNGHVTTNTKKTVCEDCGLVIEEERLDHGSEWRAGDEDERERTGLVEIHRGHRCGERRSGPSIRGPSCILKDAAGSSGTTN
jgi:hypothetical protein